MSATAPAGEHVGSRTRRRRGDLFLTGRATYVNDLTPPGTLHLAILRSPHAHARLRAVDCGPALECPGVVAALDGVAAARLAGPLPHFVDPATFGGRTVEVRCLAVDEVVYAGQPVAAVVAESLQDAVAALDAVRVDYEPLPAVLDAEHAIEPDAPRVYADWPDNLIMEGAYSEGDVDGLLAEAEHVLSGTVRIQRYSQQPIETRGYVASWDRQTERMTLHGSCQNPHPLRAVLSECLGLAESQLRIVVPDVGGAFGLKMHGHPEEPLVCVLSRMTGRPVKWIEGRDECLLVGGREQLHRFTVGFDGEGTVVALRDELIANVGALGAAPGWGMAYLSALAFPTGYRIRACDARFRIVTTNKSPWNAARGYGKEATNLVMERVMDLIARRLSLDPAEVRRRNLIRSDEFPYPTTGGLNIDSGDYHEALKRVLALVDVADVRREQAERSPDLPRLGVGLAFELTPEAGGTPGTLVGGFDSATVSMGPSGEVTVLTGVTTPGGGNDTGITQVVADRLGVDPAAIRVVQGDTDRCPYGFGNFSGRSMVVGGSAAALAADDVAAKLRGLAALMLDVPADDVELHGGHAHASGQAVPIAGVARTIFTQTFGLANTILPPLESTRVYKPDNLSFVPDERGRAQTYPTYSYAVHAAIVEVDTETGIVKLRRFGVVHDCGTIINPTLVEGQMHGAVAMGVGAALMERVVHDHDCGALATDRFKRYIMPRAGDLPDIEIEHLVTPSPYTLLGAKGAGEAGVGGALSAVVNAVDDALAPLGVVLDELPLTPPVVLRAITDAEGSVTA